ncbi:hypothetical protein [Pseudophaeobacter sp. EL27]|uniref:COG3904 family protein n=1 Tax=Pseudophaeobacter sp. EL27 TaxID=2107580 RepID=UPI0013C47D54|nr:hypothetical protein [Pseudophaeobacter sp. EL27]
MIKVAYLAICLSWLSSHCLAEETMQFEHGSYGGNCLGCQFISAQGRITDDTPDKFRTFMKTNSDGFGVVLNSEGGSLAGGLELGRLFREYGLGTSIGRVVHGSSHWDEVFNDGGCVSACAYAFLGGINRSIQEGNSIGFHQFHDPDFLQSAALVAGNQSYFMNAMDQYTSGVIVEYLVEMGIDPRLYQLASKVGPADPIRFIGQDEQVEFGIAGGSDSLGEWSILAFGDGVLAEAETSISERRVRLYCSNDGNFYLTYILPPRGSSVSPVFSYGDAESYKSDYSEFSGFRFDVMVDSLLVQTRVAVVAGIQSTGETLIALKLNRSQAEAVARASRVVFSNDRLRIPEVRLTSYYPPVFLSQILGEPSFPLNTFQLCI